MMMMMKVTMATSNYLYFNAPEAFRKKITLFRPAV